MTPNPKIRLIRRVDCLKPNWCVWEADRERPDGTLEPGFVQADFTGNYISGETWEDAE
jgi:hypothetical protein